MFFFILLSTAVILFFDYANAFHSLIKSFSVVSPKNFTLITDASVSTFIKLSGVIDTINASTLSIVSSSYSLCIHTYSCPFNQQFLSYLQTTDHPISWGIWHQFCSGKPRESKRCGLAVFDEHAYSPMESVQTIIEISLMHNEMGLLEQETVIVMCSNIYHHPTIDQDITQLLDPIQSFLSFWDRNKYRLPSNSTSNTTLTSPNPINIIIGIKSFALNSIQRLTIRQTWLKNTVYNTYNTQFGHISIKYTPYFLIGNSPNAPNGSNTLFYLQLEHSTYADMMLSPLLDVVDSYFTLTDKTLAFLQFLDGSKMDFLIMCDDDVYVDLQELSHIVSRRLIPQQRYYSGEVSYCLTILNSDLL